MGGDESVECSVGARQRVRAAWGFTIPCSCRVSRCPPPPRGASHEPSMLLLLRNQNTPAIWVRSEVQRAAAHSPRLWWVPHRVLAGAWGGGGSGRWAVSPGQQQAWLAGASPPPSLPPAAPTSIGCQQPCERGKLGAAPSLMAAAWVPRCELTPPAPPPRAPPPCEPHTSAHRLCWPVARAAWGDRSPAGRARPPPPPATGCGPGPGPAA